MTIMIVIEQSNTKAIYIMTVMIDMSSEQNVISVKSYKKKCSTCQNDITMSFQSGKWKAYELNTNEGHMCIKKFSTVTKEEKPPARPPMTDEDTPVKEELTQEEILTLKSFVALMKVVK